MRALTKGEGYWRGYLLGLCLALASCATAPPSTVRATYQPSAQAPLQQPLTQGAALGEVHGHTATSRVLRGLVILLEFPDVTPAIKRDFIETRLHKHLDFYVREMSYGKVGVTGMVTPKWYRLPKGVNAYRIAPQNIKVDRSRVRALITDALALADRDVDFGQYDFTVMLLGAPQKDYGMVGLCGWPGMLGWSTRDVLRTPRGQTVRGGIAILTYQAHLGTWFHDIAHVIGGLQDGKRRMPCLYDHDIQGRPGKDNLATFRDAMIHMGYFDPMSCHFLKRNVAPPGLSSWSRLRLGWLPPAKVATVSPGQSRELLLGPLEDPSAPVMAIRIPLSPTQYYLIENRQPLGVDKALPDHGVLIMLADDTVAECRHGQSPVRIIDADPTKPHLEGAAFDMGQKESFRDETRGVTVRLLEKVGPSYRLKISVESRSSWM